MKRLYRVARFAEISGVTVRTLHHYDQIGLLRPACQKHSKHRFYEANDFARLQQIRALRSMGFTLEEIKTLLDTRDYDLRQAMADRKAQLDAHIQDLQTASIALGQAIEALAKLDHLLESLDNTMLLPAILQNKDDWMRRYYTEDEWKLLMERAAAFKPERIQQGENDWAALIEDFRQHVHLSPEDTAVQQLAARMNALIGQFTGGHVGIENALKRMYADFDQIPEPFRQYDKTLHEFMNQALTIYRQRQNP